MIYLHTTDGQAFMFIEQGNLDRLKSGKPMSTPDGKFMLCFAPDIEWTTEQIQAMVAINGNQLDPATLEFIYREGLKREVIVR